MRKTVSCFTEEKLRELSQQPNTVVYQPTHDILYEPWSAQRVSDCVDRLVMATLARGASPETSSLDPDLIEFSQKYTVFFKKLTDPEFVKDPTHVLTVKKLVDLRARVEEGGLNLQEAQAQSADIALKSLMGRVAERRES